MVEIEKVSIIIRTCDRPLLLKRALKSVFFQTYDNFEVIVINNGGEENVVMRVVNEFNTIQREKVKVRTLDYIASRGQALNIGIYSSQGEFIAILDDDDSWNPQFLEICLKYLVHNTSIDGVATRSIVITEKLEGNDIVLLNKKIFNPQLKNASLVKIFRCNLFTINSFVYRREVVKGIGTYRSDLLALEDWEFHLRFMLKNKVEIIPIPLALYHKRINLNSSSTYVNSSVDEHLKADKQIRREYVMKFMKDRDVLGAILIYVFGMLNNISRVIKGVKMK